MSIGSEYDSHSFILSDAYHTSNDPLQVNGKYLRAQAAMTTVPSVFSIEPDSIAFFWVINVEFSWLCLNDREGYKRVLLKRQQYVHTYSSNKESDDDKKTENQRSKFKFKMSQSPRRHLKKCLKFRKAQNSSCGRQFSVLGPQP
jgi:hypothetical protein